jgi:hypothetical protein
MIDPVLMATILVACVATSIILILILTWKNPR